MKLNPLICIMALLVLLSSACTSTDNEPSHPSTSPTDTADTTDTSEDVVADPPATESGDYSATTFTAIRTVNVSDVTSLNNALVSALPGDDIVLADGTYTASDSGQDPFVEHQRFAGAFFPRTSGTVTNPIRIRAGNPGAVHLAIAPNPTNDGPVLSIGGKEYIIISDMVIDAEQSAIREDTGFVALTGSNHIYFENMIVNGSAPAAPFVNNHAIIYLQNVVESRFANNLIQNISNSTGSHKGEGIIMYGVNRTLFEFNTSQNIDGQGIYLKGDRESFGGENNYGNTIRYNYATNCGTGVQVTGNGEYVTTRTLIYQNLSDNCNKGIQLHGWSSYVDVFNNTAINNNADDGDEYTGGIVIAGVTPGANHDNRIWGNLVYGVSAQYNSWLRCLDYYTADSNYTSDYNLCEIGLRQKQNDVEYATLTDARNAGYENNTLEMSDPFVNFAGANYRLHSTNYTGGAYVPDTANIYNAPVPPGAYITGNEQIGRI